MRNFKTYASLLFAVLLMACSGDDETFNSGEATVNLQEKTMTVKESAGLCQIPIVVTGEQNGEIRLTVTVEDRGAKEDENYVITSKQIVIPADKSTANIEFRTIDDEEMNDSRSFDLTITDVQGATIGSVNKIAVTITDNDSNLYEALAGTWIFSGKVSSEKVSDVKVSFSVKVSTAEEGTEAYENYLVCTNSNGFDPDGDINWDFDWRMKYEYDAATKKISLGIVSGEDVAANGNYTIRFRRVAIDGSTTPNLMGDYDKDTKTITFENANLSGDLYNKGVILAQKFRLFECTMERIR